LPTKGSAGSLLLMKQGRPRPGIALPALAFGQSPSERAASNLEQTFTGPLARALALVAIVIGGLMFMFGEGGAKRRISGIVFGGGLALFCGPVPRLVGLKRT
jgi:type IV secretory pathway VirB2 component (pilin)